MRLAVEIMDLNKKFLNTKALDNLSLKIEEGKIYGLLGRNGAGKTTLLKIITAQYVKSSGTVKVFGEESFENEKALSKICFVSDKPKFIPTFTVREIFNIARAFNKNWDREFEKKLIKEFEVDLNKQYKNLSKGMQSIVSIIIGLASRAAITIYDEAYTGLDAVAREKFYHTLLEDYSENPRTIIFSTHLIDEVSKLFENVIIIHKGKVILEEETDLLRTKAFYINGDSDKVSDVIKNKNVIYKEVIGNNINAAVLYTISKEEKVKIENMGLEIKSMPLQKLFIHLTSIESEGR